MAGTSFDRKYELTEQRRRGSSDDPGLIVSVLVNISVGVFTIWYFLEHHLITVPAHIIGLLIGLSAQAGLMIYGFAILKPSIPTSLRANRS